MIEHTKILQTAKSKRIYITICLLLVAFWISILIILSNKYPDSKALEIILAKEILVDLITTTIISSIIFGLVVFLLPFEKEFTEVMVTEPDRTKKMFIDAVSSTDSWLHKWSFREMGQN